MDEQLHERAPVRAPESAPAGVRRRRFGAAQVLILANVAVFAVMCAKGASLFEPTREQGIAMGANYGPLIAQGEWWRLLTAAFVHFGVLHLLVNMIALNSLAIVEPLLGTPGFLYAYFTSALGASVSSVLWRPLGTSAGASGALFGLLGALLAFFLTHRRFIAPQVFGPMIRNILIMIGINVVFGLSVQFVDNAAHLGGLATGFLAGLCMYRTPVLVSESPRVIGWAPLPGKQLVAAVLLALVIAAGAALLPRRVRGDPSLEVTILLGQVDSALKRGDTSDAAAALDRALSLDDALPLAHRQRARLRQLAGDTEGALHDLDRAIQLDERDATALAERAHVLDASGMWEPALRDFQAAGDRDDSGAMQVYAWLARAHMGAHEREPATTELASYLAGSRGASMNSTWHRIALVLIGKDAEQNLVTWAENTAAHGPNPGDRTSAARALFVAGSLRELDGDKAAAKQLFEHSLELASRDYADYLEATAALERVAK
jgi:rhomboid protease GluP